MTDNGLVIKKKLIHFLFNVCQSRIFWKCFDLITFPSWINRLFWFYQSDERTMFMGKFNLTSLCFGLFTWLDYSNWRWTAVTKQVNRRPNFAFFNYCESLERTLLDTMYMYLHFYLKYKNKLNYYIQSVLSHYHIMTGEVKWPLLKPAII